MSKPYIAGEDMRQGEPFVVSADGKAYIQHVSDAGFDGVTSLSVQAGETFKSVTQALTELTNHYSGIDALMTETNTKYAAFPPTVLATVDRHFDFAVRLSRDGANFNLALYVALVRLAVDLQKGAE